MKSFITAMFLIVLMASFVFAGVTEMKIWTDEPLTPNTDFNNAVTGNTTRFGEKTTPASFYIVRWALNQENVNHYMKITSDDPKPAAGPFCMDFQLGAIPSNQNCWMDMRRDDAAPGWNEPLDASATERVTFWIKSAKNNPPLWFYVSNFDSPAGSKNFSVHVRVEGQTVVTQDQFGEYAVKLATFDGTWQFVSLPWTFLMEKDSLMVHNLIPYSFVHEGTTLPQDKDGDGAAYSFDPAKCRSLTWVGNTSDDGPWTYWNATYRKSPNCKWLADPALKIEKARYSLDEIVFCLNDGTGITDVNGQQTVMPLLYTLEQNYPNPFNPTTDITYAIPVSNHVSIDIFNMMGQKVKTLVDRYMTAGTYQAKWDGTDDMGRSMTSGTYFYKMSSSHFNSVKKMLFVK
jgi:hypothetical protein